MTKKVDFTTATTSFTTVSGNYIDTEDKNVNFYVLEQRDIEFLIDMAWIHYKLKARLDYWVNVVIGIILGMLSLSIFK